MRRVDLRVSVSDPPDGLSMVLSFLELDAFSTPGRTLFETLQKNSKVRTANVRAYVQDSEVTLITGGIQATVQTGMYVTANTS